MTYSESSSSVTLFPSSPALLLPTPTTPVFVLPPIIRNSYYRHRDYEGFLYPPNACFEHRQGPPEFILLNSTTIPLNEELSVIIPVDPMAWSFSRPSDEADRVHDVLQTRNHAGELAFWAYDADKHDTWVCTGKVRTSGRQIRMARCSSAKKTALGMFI